LFLIYANDISTNTKAFIAFHADADYTALFIQISVLSTCAVF